MEANRRLATYGHYLYAIEYRLPGDDPTDHRLACLGGAAVNTPESAGSLLVRLLGHEALIVTTTDILSIKLPARRERSAT